MRFNQDKWKVIHGGKIKYEGKNVRQKIAGQKLCVGVVCRGQRHDKEGWSTCDCCRKFDLSLKWDAPAAKRVNTL